MASFTKITSHAVVITAENIDTDQIIPARFLKVIDKDGLGESLFCDWRYLPDGSDNPDFPLNFPRRARRSCLRATISAVARRVSTRRGRSSVGAFASSSRRPSP